MDIQKRVIAECQYIWDNLNPKDGYKPLSDTQVAEITESITLKKEQGVPLKKLNEIMFQEVGEAMQIQ